MHQLMIKDKDRFERMQSGVITAFVIPGNHFNKYEVNIEDVNNIVYVNNTIKDSLYIKNSLIWWGLLTNSDDICMFACGDDVDTRLARSLGFTSVLEMRGYVSDILTPEDCGNFTLIEFEVVK